MNKYRDNFCLSMVRNFLIRPTLSIAYKYSVEGRDNLPDKGPAVIVCKHQSWMDLFAVAYAVPRPMKYIAKRELFENLLGDYKGSVLEKIGSVMTGFSTKCLCDLGAIPLDREYPEKKMSTFKKIRELMGKDEFLVLFPEGRIFPGEMGEFKSGMIEMLVKMQAKTKIPLKFVPVGISYEKKSFAGKHLLVKIGESLKFESYEGASEALKEKIAALTDFNI